MTRRRREVLLGATAALAATGGLPAPAIAQGIKELKLVTDWPEGLAGLDTGAQRLARSITAISDGRLKVTVYPSGSLVRPSHVQQPRAFVAPLNKLWLCVKALDN